MGDNEKKRDAWCREAVEGFDKKKLFPVSRTKGMGDCVRDWYGYYRVSTWMDFREDILDNTTLYPGGSLIYDPNGIPSFITDYDSSSGYFDWLNRARVKYYNMFLCTDGKIRYIKNPESEMKCVEECKKQEAEWWEQFERSMESMGYVYVDSEGAWYNAQTNDWACY